MKELRALAASKSFWLFLLVTGVLVGQAFTTSVNLYAEASGIGGGPAALAQGLNPLEGIVVPTFGAYDIVATLLFPFVVIRLFAGEKQSGELALSLQAPAPFPVVIIAKALALLAAWLVSGVAGAAALVIWTVIGGHLHAAEVWNAALGHVLRGFLTIGIGAAAGALAASAASAAIVALTFTIGTWAIDYVAAARGGLVAAIASYTPEAALRTFESGELRVATILVLLTIGVAGLAAAAIWLREGEPGRRRTMRLVGLVVASVGLCATFGRLTTSWDVSESRRNSFSKLGEQHLRSLEQPLTVTVFLAAEDPRLADLERGVLAKLRRTVPELDVRYAASSRSGLFEKSGEQYGEVWYQLGRAPDARREMTRSTTEEIVLETIYSLTGETRPATTGERAYPGYPLARRALAAPWVFFLGWPLLVAVVWWVIRRPRFFRVQP